MTCIGGFLGLIAQVAVLIMFLVFVIGWIAFAIMIIRGITKP